MDGKQPVLLAVMTNLRGHQCHRF